MDCPPQKMAVVERWPSVEIRLLLITEKRDLIQFFKVHFVVTAFDCKDENSFGFSLFVDVRFKLCSVLLIWIKHSLLFQNTVEPPLTVTSTQRPPTATPLQRPFFFWRTVHALNLVSTSLHRPPLYNYHLSWRTVHTFTLGLASLQRSLSSFPKVEKFNCTQKTQKQFSLVGK